MPSPAPRSWIIIRPMRPPWHKARLAAPLLLAVALIAHVPLAWACIGTSSTSQRMPCCPCPTPDPQSTPDPSAGIAGLGLIVYTTGCAALNHCACAQPLSAARVLSAPLRSSHGVRIPAPVWGEFHGAVLKQPRSQGPPLARYAALIGRQTYLATLRLRI